MENKFKKGQFCWVDMAVDNPTTLKDFYKGLFEWKDMAIPMKDGEDRYEDYAMMIDEQTSGGGICHNKGGNQNLPKQWIPYFYIENVKEAIDQCINLGGSVVKSNQKSDGSYNYALLKDPEGLIFGIGNMT